MNGTKQSKDIYKEKQFFSLACDFVNEPILSEYGQLFKAPITYIDGSHSFRTASITVNILIVNPLVIYPLNIM